MKLRLINIITGAARFLPTQHVRKLKMTDLAKIKFETKSEYLATRLRRLYTKNKYLPPKNIVNGPIYYNIWTIKEI